MPRRPSATTGLGSSPLTSVTSTRGSLTVLRIRSMAPSTVSPTMTRMLTWARAVAAMTLAPGDPESWVTATVVRVSAAVSWPSRASTCARTGRRRRAWQKTAPNGIRACAPTCSIISTVASGRCAGKGRFSGA